MGTCTYPTNTSHWSNVLLTCVHLLRHQHQIHWFNESWHHPATWWAVWRTACTSRWTRRGFVVPVVVRLDIGYTNICAYSVLGSLSLGAKHVFTSNRKWGSGSHLECIYLNKSNSILFCFETSPIGLQVWGPSSISTILRYYISRVVSACLHSIFEIYTCISKSHF